MSEGKPNWIESAFSEWLEWRCDENACAVCRSFDRNLYEPATEERMPPEGCTCEGGCKCEYVRVPYPPEPEGE